MIHGNLSKIVDKGSSEVERRFRELGRKQVIEDYGEVSDERLHKKQVE